MKYNLLCLATCWMLTGTGLLSIVQAGPPTALAKPVVAWRFVEPGELLGWGANGHLTDVTVADGHLQARAVGADPILIGPVFSIDATPTQYIEVRMKSDRSGPAEIFWTETLRGRFGGFSQAKTIRFSVLGDNQMHTYRLRPFWHKMGHIVRLRFDPPNDATIEVERIAIVEETQVVRSTEQAWRFHGAAHGWRADTGVGELEVDSGGLHFTPTTRGATLLSPLIDLRASDHPLVAVRMAVTKGTRGMIYCASSDRVGWHGVSFALRADGKMHTYNVDMTTLAAWAGNIVTLGVNPTDAVGARVDVESIQMARTPCGPPELEVVYLGSADGVSRTGRPAGIVCQVRNLGGRPAEKVVATLSVPSSVAVVGRCRQLIDSVAFGQSRQVTWSLQATRPAKVSIQMRVEAPELEPATAAATISFTRPPVIASDRAGGNYVPEPRPVASRFEIGAFYFPGWPNMTRWRPILDYPMRRPVLGWYDESNPECADWQIKWAVEHGVRFFMVDWYWSQGRRQLEHWLHDAYMHARYRKYLKWAVMWANHNRPGTHSVEDWKKVTQYWIDHYFHMDEYYRIDGRPAVFIWSPANVRHDLGSSQKAAALYTMSQQMARRAGLPGIYFVAMSAHESAANCKTLKAEGYEAFTSYHTFQLAAARAGSRNFSYEKVVETSPEVWRAADARRSGLDYFPVVDTGWDSRPWHKNKARVVYGRTPQLFGRLCREARDYATRNKKKIIVLGPWNEWGEGSYIEPYAEYGFGDLDALRSALCAPGDYPPDVVPADIGRGPYDCVEEKK